MFSKDLFCNKLKLLRIERNLTLEQLGAIFNVTKQTVSRWESGDRIPSIEIIYALAEYFNVSIDFLTGRTDNPDISFNSTELTTTPEEIELLEDFRQLNKYEQKIILGKVSEIIYNKNVENNYFKVAEETANMDYNNKANK